MAVKKSRWAIPPKAPTEVAEEVKQEQIIPIVEEKVEKEVILEPVKVVQEIEDPTAEEFIAALPKKRNKKKVLETEE